MRRTIARRLVQGLVAIGTLAFGRAASAQTIQFDPPIVTSVSSRSPNDLAVADFNGDGHLDVVETDPVQEFTRVLFGQGDGTFGSTSLLGSNAGPRAIAAGDINEDGHADIVVSGWAAQQLLVYLGNGNGTFVEQAYAAPGPLDQIVLADVNGDGAPDVLGPYSGPSGSGIAVFLNDGTGHFPAPAGVFGSGVTAVGLATGDFNGDGHIDVAAAWRAGSANLGVSVFVGAGNGSFDTGTFYGTTGEPLYIVAADVTGDHITDLLVSQSSPTPALNGVAVFPGTGGGTFLGPRLISPGTIVGRIAALDVNRDGVPDLLGAGGDGLLAWTGDTEGNFEGPIDFPTNGGPFTAVGDLNGDGKPDAITLGGSDTNITVLLNSTPAVTLGPGQAVTWIDAANVTVSGDSIQKSGGCDGCFDASAASAQAIDGTTDSGVEFTLATGPLLAAGLSRSPNPTSLEAVDFAIRPQGTSAEVRELGVFQRDIPFTTGDVFRILIQSNVVRYLKNGAPFYVSQVAPAYPLHVGAVMANAGAAVSNASIFGVSSSGGAGGGGSGGGFGTWTAGEDVSATNGTIAKVSGCDGCYDSFTTSEAAIVSGNGFFQFTVNDTTPLLTVGLSSSFDGLDPTTIQYGLRLQDGDAEVEESGVYRTDVVFHSGDVFRITDAGGIITYAVNGSTFYTSGTPTASPLIAAVALAGAGAEIVDVTVEDTGASGNSDTWTFAQNVTAADGTISKTSGCDGCYDAWTTSESAIESGNGFFEFTIGNTAPLLTAGLTSSFDEADPSSIQFGLRLQDGDAEVRESGAYRADVTFQSEDVFRISVAAGVVTYAINGTVFYTSGTVASSPLIAAVALAGAGAEILDAVVGGA